MRYSKQREAINSFLAKTKSHPTAEEVYIRIKKEIPDISLATVYRNLHRLEDMNLIKKLDTGGREARYDADLSDHSHFVCEKCGRVYDMFNEIVTSETIADILGDGFTVQRKMIYAYGICKKCN